MGSLPQRGNLSYRFSEIFRYGQRGRRLKVSKHFRSMQMNKNKVNCRKIYCHESGFISNLDLGATTAKRNYINIFEVSKIHPLGTGGGNLASNRPKSPNRARSVVSRSLGCLVAHSVAKLEGLTLSSTSGVICTARTDTIKSCPTCCCRFTREAASEHPNEY